MLADAVRSNTLNGIRGCIPSSASILARALIGVAFWKESIYDCSLSIGGRTPAGLRKERMQEVRDAVSS